MNARPLLTTSALAAAIAFALLSPASALAQDATEPPAATPQQAESADQPPQPKDDARELDTVEVQGQYTGSDYSVQSTSSATKLDLKLKETPQSVTVFTEQLMQDMDIRDVHGMVAATPGAATTAYGIPGTGAYRMMARGFNIDNFTIDGIRVNDSVLGGVSGAAIQDSFLYERVDLVRGSTGLTSGFGNPSASVNFLRKRPTANRQGQLNLKYGSWDSQRIEADYSGPLNTSGTWRGRVAAATDKGGFWIDRASQNGYMLYGITELDVGNGMFTLGASQQYKRFDELSPHGIKNIPAYMYGPISRDYCDPESVYQNANGVDYCSIRYTDEENGIDRSFNNATDWTYIWYKMTNAFAGYKYTFDSGWELAANYNYGVNEMAQEYGAIGVYGFAAPQPFDLASLSTGFGDMKYETNALDVHLKGHFELFDREQKFVVGLDGYKSEQETSAATVMIRLLGGCSPNYMDHDNDGINDYIQERTWQDSWEGNSRGLGVGCSVRVSEWNGGHNSMKNPYHDQMKGMYPDGIMRHERRELGAYFALHLRPMENLQVIAGGRYYELKHEREFIFFVPWGQVYGDPNPSGFFPYAGAIYEITPEINAYVSYTGISSTTHFAGRSMAKDGSYLPPVEGNTWEAGIKAGFHDDRLNVALSFFHMTQKNWPTIKINEESGSYDFIMTPWFTLEPAAVPDKEGYTVKGVELNVAGDITERWKINAGYVYQTKHGPVFDLHQALDGDAEWQTYNEISWNEFLFPRRQFKLFTSYQLNDALTLGAGLTWQDTVRAWTAITADVKDITDPDMVQKSYAVVSAMARYKVSDKLALGLNVGNLFDKEYVTNRNGSFYGAPRSWSLSVNYRF